MCFPYGGKLCVRNESLEEEKVKKSTRNDFFLAFSFILLSSACVFLRVGYDPG